MRPGRRSLRLAGTVLEQTLGHAAVPEAAPESARPPPGHEHDLIIPELEVDLVARMKVHLISDRLRNHDLPLRPDPSSHICRE